MICLLNMMVFHSYVKLPECEGPILTIVICLVDISTRFPDDYNGSDASRLAA